ncbi:YibE/F family protein [Lactovum miscens]|uniref:YibE/F family protein n=1 Tax=Lactovum miscens TaxID=190387 RepID=UPI002ED9FF9B
MVKFIFKIFMIPIILATLAFAIFSNDQFLYSEPVGLITAIKTTSTSTVKDEFNNYDKSITQILNIKLLNKSQKTIQIENTATLSQTDSQVYQIGQQVILNQNKYPFQIRSLKRDAILAAIIVLIVSFLITFMRWRASLYLILSLILSIIYFIIAIRFNLEFTDISSLLIYGTLALVFSFSALSFVLGLNRQMIFTFLTTIISTTFTFLLVITLLSMTHSIGINFEYMEFITKNPQTLFFMGASISVLGAIMDCCGDIVAGLFALFRQNPKTNQKSFFHSGINIGQEITGTLTNVLFMIFIAGTLPMTFLLLRNGNSWSYILSVALNLGLLQTLISAIGIILSVPITAWLTAFFLSRQKEKV